MAGPIWRAAVVGCGRIADSIEDEVADAPGWTLLPFSHAGAYQRWSERYGNGGRAVPS